MTNLQETTVGLPNSCAKCGRDNLTVWYAANDDEARSGLGVCANCLTLAEPKPITPDAAATEPEAIPIFMMSKQELLDAARQRGIGVDPKWKKSQIADVLTAAISAEL